MFKWHVHSAIGRGRPLAGDLAKVADGIASSLRQFHLSASPQTKNEGEAPSLSRAQRTAAAAAEISSLNPVDARSLAATPPPRFTIRREAFGSATGNGGRGGTKTPPTYMGRSPRGPSVGIISRGVGRGGRRGRGRGEGQGRGGRTDRGGRGRRSRGGMKPGDDLFAPDVPYTAKEQAYLDGVAMGILTPAPVGITSRESLENEVPALATSTAPIGLTATIRDRLRALSGQHGNEYLTSEHHGELYRNGSGTFFVDKADKAYAISPERWALAPRKYKTLDDAEKQAVWKTLVGGEYPPIKPITEGETVDNVETYALRNESYLQRDVTILKAKMQRMLPARRPANPIGQRAAR